MSFSPDTFRANFPGSGARSNLFQVSLAFPTFATDAGNASSKVQFLAKAASLPGSKLGVIQNINFGGRQIKYPGDRTFQDWKLTILNDEDFKIRAAFDSWMNAINSHVGNTRSPQAFNITDYQVDAYIKQYSKIGGSPIRQYRFVGVWPSDLEDIAVSFDDQDKVEEFGVTLTYQWWEVWGGPSGPGTDLSGAAPNE